ncbi:hypothetical protein CP01DC11_1272, partial [Chlamydia psittaci 01DC11]
SKNLPRNEFQLTTLSSIFNSACISNINNYIISLQAY